MRAQNAKLNGAKLLRRHFVAQSKREQSDWDMSAKVKVREGRATEMQAHSLKPEGSVASVGAYTCS